MRYDSVLIQTYAQNRRINPRQDKFSHRLTQASPSVNTDWSDGRIQKSLEMTQLANRNGSVVMKISI
jgi:hypothetical protein